MFFKNRYNNAKKNFCDISKATFLWQTSYMETSVLPHIQLGYLIVPVSIRPTCHLIASKWFWQGFACVGGTVPLVAVHTKRSLMYRAKVVRLPVVSSVWHLVISKDTFLIKGYLVIIYLLNPATELVSMDISGKSQHGNMPLRQGPVITDLLHCTDGKTRIDALCAAI